MLFIVPFEEHYDGVIDWIDANADIIDSDGNVVDVSRRIVYADDPPDEDLYSIDDEHFPPFIWADGRMDRIEFHDFPGPGWYTVRVKRRDDIDLHINPRDGVLSTDDHWLAYLLIGVSAPGIRRVEVCEEHNYRYEHRDKTSIGLHYSEYMTVTAMLTSNIEIIDESGQPIACEPDPRFFGDETEADTTHESSVFFIFCEKIPVSGIRIREQPISITGSPAVFPETNTIWDIQDREPSSPNCSVWVTSEPWPVPGVKTGIDHHETESLRGVEPGGCSSTSGGGSFFAALLLAMTPLWRRRYGRVIEGMLLEDAIGRPTPWPSLLVDRVAMATPRSSRLAAAAHGRPRISEVILPRTLIGMAMLLTCCNGAPLEQTEGYAEAQARLAPDERVVYRVFPGSYSTNIVRVTILDGLVLDSIASSLVATGPSGDTVELEITGMDLHSTAPEADDDPAFSRDIRSGALIDYWLLVSGFSEEGWHRIFVPNRLSPDPIGVEEYRGSEDCFVRSEEGYFADFLVGISRPGLVRLVICDYRERQDPKDMLVVQAEFSQGVRLLTPDITGTLFLLDESGEAIHCYDGQRTSSLEDGYQFSMAKPRTQRVFG